MRPADANWQLISTTSFSTRGAPCPVSNKTHPDFWSHLVIRCNSRRPIHSKYLPFHATTLCWQKLARSGFQRPPQIHQTVSGFEHHSSNGEALCVTPKDPGLKHSTPRGYLIPSGKTRTPKLSKVPRKQPTKIHVQRGRNPDPETTPPRNPRALGCLDFPSRTASGRSQDMA